MSHTLTLAVADEFVQDGLFINADERDEFHAWLDSVADADLRAWEADYEREQALEAASVRDFDDDRDVSECDDDGRFESPYRF